MDDDAFRESVLQSDALRIKFIMIGNSDVGKTSLMVRYFDSQFLENTKASIGVDVKVQRLEILDRKVKLYVFDTAGQERMRSITKSYYRQAMGVILVYDVTSQTSFDDVEQWIRKIDENAKEDLLKILVANKIDKDDRVISTQMGIELANRMKMTYYEASAMKGFGLDNIFYGSTQKLVE